MYSRVWCIGILIGATAAGCGDDETNGSTSNGGSGGGGAVGGVGNGGAGAAGAAGAGGAGGSGGVECQVQPGVPGAECDVVDQDCADPCAPRCVLYIAPNASGLAEPRCMAERTNAAAHETCNRYGGAVGDDDCAGGLFCSYGIGRASGITPPDFCTPYCETDDDCGGGGVCVKLTNASVAVAAGFCGASCVPFADGCEGAYDCVKFTATDGDFKLTCSDQMGIKAAGVACQGGDCGAGLSCENVAGLVCTPFCDVDHPCPNAEPCVTPPDGVGYTVCDL